MVTIDDIVTRCMNLSTKYHHGPEHTRDLVELAKVVMTFCQDRLGPVDEPPKDPA